MKYRWTHKWKRIIAGGLAVLMLCPGTGASPEAYGAEAAVDVDETMYVNLDFYGAATKVNVVKSCSFNGRTQYTDYGRYLDVKNMTNEAVPVLEEGAVKWTMPEPYTGRFYYQCTMDVDQVVLPWNFDVSYKLNGVPTDADKLAGASGVVEINIKALPNDKAGAYYRDNMLLMAAVPVDMSKCYSVEAEGSQTQNLGETTAVVFSALPGEEGDFTVRIGTDSFETIGVILSMVPGTMEDLEHIKDIKEAKDTWKDAGDQLYDSMEQMALSVEGMREGVNQVQAGMDSAESARQKWSSSKDSILEGNDQALAALTAMSAQMDAMVPYLQTAKDSAEVVHRSMNDIVNTLGEMQDPLQKLYNRLRNIKSSSESISENLPEIQAAMEELLLLDFQLQQNEDLFLLNLRSARSSSLRANSLYYDEDPDEDEIEDDEEFYWSDDFLGINGKTQNPGGNDGGSKDTADAPTGEGSASGKDGTAAPTGEGSASGKDGTAASTGEGSTSGKDGTAAPTGEGSASDKDGTAALTGEGSASGKDGTAAPTGEGSTSGKDGTAASNGEGSASGKDGTAAPTGEGSASGKDGTAPTGEGSTSGKDGDLGSLGDVSSAEDAGGSSPDTPQTLGSRSLSIEKRSLQLLGTGSASDIISGLAGKGKALTTIAGQSKELTDAMSSLMGDTSDAAKYSSELVDNLDFLIEDITALNDSLDVYYPDLQACLDDTKELVNCTTDALNSGISTLTIVQNTLKDTSNDFDSAARDSLRGSMALLDKSLNILDSTTSIRHAGRTMKDTMDNELDKFDTENRFLFMDPSAEKVSFTSEKNKAPKTLQIVLRTDEISLDDGTVKTADAESAKAVVSPLRRMWNVLVEMWRAVVSIFKNR